MYAEGIILAPQRSVDGRPDSPPGWLARCPAPCAPCAGSRVFPRLLRRPSVLARRWDLHLQHPTLLEEDDLALACAPADPHVDDAPGQACPLLELRARPGTLPAELGPQ